jgi:hypothetical protein
LSLIRHITALVVLQGVCDYIVMFRRIALCKDFFLLNRLRRTKYLVLYSFLIVLSLFENLAYGYERIETNGLKPYIQEVFKDARVVTIKYIPVRVTVSPSKTVNVIEQGWKYSFSQQCRSACGLYFPDLINHMGKGVLLDKLDECQIPMKTLLELVSENRIKTQIFFDQTGTCFQIEKQGRVYSTKKSANTHFNKIWSNAVPKRIN